MSIKAIKGFDRDFKCRGFQFEAGKTFTHSGDVKACRGGFHAVPDDLHPLTVFEFYPPSGSRFALVEVSGAMDREENKIAAEILEIGLEVDLRDLTLAAVEFVTSRAKLEGPVAIKENGLATASGDQGAATASGYQGAATASGTRGAATASGDQGAATASGKLSSAHATANGGRVMGDIDGVSLFAREIKRDGGDYVLSSVACGITGRDGVRSGVWYRCEGGKLVEVAA